MTEEYKLKKIQVVQRAFVTKSTAYMCAKGRGFEIRPERTYLGSHILKAVYDSKNNKVDVYDQNGKVETVEGKKAKVAAAKPKSNKNTSDVRDTSNEKSD